RQVEKSWTGFTDSPTYADAKAVAGPLIEALTQDTAEGGVDELHIVFTEFVSMMTQTPFERRMLPLSFEKTAEESAQVFMGDRVNALYDLAPSAEEVLDVLLPRYVESRVYNTL